MMKDLEKQENKGKDIFFMWAFPCAVAIIIMSYLAGKDEALRDNRAAQTQIGENYNGKSKPSN